MDHGNARLGTRQTCDIARRCRWFQHERHPPIVEGSVSGGFSTSVTAVYAVLEMELVRLGPVVVRLTVVANERGRERERGTCTIASRADAARRSVVPRALGVLCTGNSRLTLARRSTPRRESCACADDDERPAKRRAGRQGGRRRAPEAPLALPCLERAGCLVAVHRAVFAASVARPHEH